MKLPKFLRQLWFWCMLAGLILSSIIIWLSIYFAWFPGKTPWDWLSLLVIPAALALVALFFNQMNTRTERQIAKQRYKLSGANLSEADLYKADLHKANLSGADLSRALQLHFFGTILS